MDANNEIRLRLRFYKDVPENIESVRQKFENYKANCTEDCHLKIKHNHIWMNIPRGKTRILVAAFAFGIGTKRKQQNTYPRIIWSRTHFVDTFYVSAFYGGWNFCHFYAGIAYSDYVLKQFDNNGFNRNVMLLMVIVWFLLYFIAKQIRFKGNEQMNELEGKFLEILVPKLRE